MLLSEVEAEAEAVMGLGMRNNGHIVDEGKGKAAAFVDEVARVGEMGAMR